MTAPPLPGAAPPRSHRPLWVLVAIVALPIAEIAVLIAIGHWIGVLATIGLVILVGVLGIVLLVIEGPRALRNLRDAVSPRTTVDGQTTVRSVQQLPTRELSDGALVAIGALLLVLPGFISDVLAIACLLPVTRPLLRKLLGATVRRRTDRAAARRQGRAQGPVVGQVVITPDDEGPPHPRRDTAVEGRIIEPGPGDRP